MDGRALPLMALTALVVLAVQYLRGGELSFREAVFSAAFIGFTLAAGWYLLSRRSPGLSKGARIQGLSALVAGSFGLLWGLAPS